jgi:hypothetical protein
VEEDVRRAVLHGQAAEAVDQIHPRTLVLVGASARLERAGHAWNFLATLLAALSLIGAHA